MKPKKSTKPRKAGSKKKKAGLKGAAKLKAATKGLTESIAKPSGVLVGLVLGSVASNLLDKIPFLAPPAEGTEDDGKFNVKKIVKPLILLVVGAGTVVLTHSKKGAAMQFVNGLGYGVAGGGVLSGIKAVTGKSLTSGLGEAGANRKVLEATYLKEQLNDMAKQLEEHKFESNLEDKANTDSVGRTDWGTQMIAENSDMVM